jgi:hypothetical protein
MHLQFITDIKGRKTAVQLPVKDWERIQRDLEELDKYRDKGAFFDGLKEAFAEVKEIEAGRKKGTTLNEFLNELHGNTNR